MLDVRKSKMTNTFKEEIKVRTLYKGISLLLDMKGSIYPYLSETVKHGISTHLFDSQTWKYPFQNTEIKSCQLPNEAKVTGVHKQKEKKKCKEGTNTNKEVGILVPWGKHNGRKKREREVRETEIMNDFQARTNLVFKKV